MADEYQWLDQEAAERLLRGEPVDPVGTSARAQAELLARALDTARTPAVGPLAGTGGELPGEAAALAAFRKAAAERAAAPGHAGQRAVADLGAVRLARVRAGRGWGRSLRYGLAAAVAAVTVGGVAVAAGTGVLPLTADPEPGRSVVAVDPSSSGWSGSPTGGTGTAVSGGPDGGGRPGTPGATDGTATADPDATAGPDDPGTRPGGNAGGTDGETREQERARTIRACQDFRAGTLGSGGRQRLTAALRDGETVKRYCDRILSGAPSGATPTTAGRTSSGSTGGKGGNTDKGGTATGGSESGGSDSDDTGGDRGDRDPGKGKGPGKGSGQGGSHGSGSGSVAGSGSGSVAGSGSGSGKHDSDRSRSQPRPGV